jgi:hypothetical protein
MSRGESKVALLRVFLSPFRFKGGDKNNQTYEPLKATTRCKRERSPALEP